MFEPLARYAVKQSTTALTNASLASDRLEEMERSIAANRYRDRDDVSSKAKQTRIDYNDENNSIVIIVLF